MAQMMKIWLFKAVALIYLRVIGGPTVSACELWHYANSWEG